MGIFLYIAILLNSDQESFGGRVSFDDKQTRDQFKIDNAETSFTKHPLQLFYW
jgi:hypothetical protein